MTESPASKPGAPAHTPSAAAISLGKWIHEHKASTSDNLLGYTVYQYLRSAAASVPYGLSMAGTWLAFEKVARAAQGKSTYTHMFTTSPLVRTGAMIGTSFTLYRATSKIGKWINEYLFNPDDTLEETIDKVDHLPEALSNKMKEVYLPEAHSTFISAFALSALVCYGLKTSASSEHLAQALGHTKELLQQHGKFSSEAWGHFWKEAIANPKAQFVPQAAVNSLGYSLFFELGDRRFKDKQMSRGMWAGRAHAIGSASKANPSLLQEAPSWQIEPDGAHRPDRPDPVHSGDESDELSMRGHVGELPTGSRMGDTLSVLTSEPSFLRFGLRRFIPTAIGITAYTALKFRGGKLFFGDFANKDTGFQEMSKLSGFLRNAAAEGSATSLFFMIPWVTDKYAPAFDRFVNTLEAKISGRSYDQVVAGYQPPAARHNQPTRMAANDQPAPSEDAPQTQVAMPVAEKARIAQASVQASPELHA